MRTSLHWMLAGTAMLAAAPAFAANPAETAAETDAAAEAATDGEIVVFGEGLTRQTADIDQQTLAVSAPAVSPLKAIAKLPGVNFQSSDPFGGYEWAQRISIRGFNQNQLGFTFDGVPLGDASYGNHNGLHVSRAAISENIGGVSVTQGAGAIGTASTNNLGGTVATRSADPRGGFILNGSASYGTDNMYRGYARAEFGDDEGLRALASVAHYKTDKWKGFGEQKSTVANFKIVAPITNDVDVSAWYSYSDRAEQDYQDLSLEQIDRLGYFADNFSYEQLALANLLADVGANTGYTGAAPQNPGAGTRYPFPYTSPDDAYLDAAGLRRDHLAYVKLSSDGETFGFDLTGYYHNNEGQGLWGTPYVASPGGTSPYAIRTTEYGIDRMGAQATVNADLGVVDATVGVWYENNDFHQARRFYALSSRTDTSRSFTSFQEDPFFTQWEFDFNTKTYQYFVETKAEFGGLGVSAGWKGFSVENTAIPIISGGRAQGETAVTDWFQPHVGVTYDLGEAEFFGGFTQATRSFASATTAGPFATSQIGFDGLGDLKPETSNTFEAGLRYKTSMVNAVVAGYYVDFDNRIISFANGAGIVGNPAILRNVGSVRSVGVEAGADVRLGEGYGFYVSYAYNDSTYRNDVLNADGSVFAATAGKTTVDSPKHIGYAEINFDYSGFFGQVGASYQSKRYFTYENTHSVDGRFVVDASIGYRISEYVEIRGNATNLFDERYIGTIGTNGFGNRGDAQTLHTAAPQAFFITLKLGR